jgi:putative transposase
MARRAKLLVAGVPHHILQRGHDRQPVFFGASDYGRYLDWLRDAGKTYNCRIYAYVLMANHIHLLASAEEPAALSRMMKHLSGRYARHFNLLYRHSGSLWEGPFKANPIDPETHFLKCCRYMECHPLRERLASHPKDYPWSSYRFHADGSADTWLSTHEMYERLGSTAEQRRQVYHDLCSRELTTEELTEIRESIVRGWPLGGERFKDEIENALHRPVRPLKRGRPPIQKVGKSAAAIPSRKK